MRTDLRLDRHRVFLPPIGVGLFIAYAIARLNIVESAKHMAPFPIMITLGLLVVTYVPWFTLVLPAPS